MIGAPLGRMINPFVDASLFSLDMSIKVPACKPLKTKMTPRAETRQPNLTWARLGPPPPEQAELFQAGFSSFSLESSLHISRMPTCSPSPA